MKSDQTVHYPQSTVKFKPKAIPETQDLTMFFKHGGFHSILDAKTVALRVDRVKKRHPEKFAETDALAIAAAMANTFFFFHLVPDKPYNLNSSLISHISLYERGRVFSHVVEEINPNRHIPTVFTFIGQFIDHDLTLNMIDLIGRAGNAARSDIPNDLQTYAVLGEDPNSPDKATPFIDLDSVYGPRDVLVGGNSIWDIIDIQTGKFFMNYNHQNNFFDFCRIESGDNMDGTAYIFDKRNDENQVISQIHLLILRLHNTLVDKGNWQTQFTPGDENSVMAFVLEVRKEVVRTWQSVVWHQYLPVTISQEPLHRAKHEAMNSPKPNCMPHEFSIGSRMGHSQLRPSYRLNAGNIKPIPLFDNQVLPVSDLRGNHPLEPEHAIDWPFFLDDIQSMQTSNKIDSKVTSVVFNLPETTIPDNVKGVVNLPQRNLMRSEQVQLASGEDLADYFHIQQQRKLTPDQIEPDPNNQKLFKIDNNGHFNDANPFRTPLWYYVLKEAELLEDGKQLGPVGGRIIGEVIAKAIWHQDYSFINPATSGGWLSVINGSSTVMFQDIVNYVLSNENPAATPACHT